MINIDRIESTALPDSRVKSIIDRFGCINVRGMRHTNPTKPIAFAYGNRLHGYPIGSIYVHEWAFLNLTDYELEWIVLHELAHIVNDHLPAKMFLEIISVGGAALLTSVFNISFPLATLCVAFLRTI